MLALLLLCLAAWLGHHSCLAAALPPTTVNVSTSQQLLAALSSRTGDTTIVLQGDLALGPEFERLEGNPLKITKNITITGPEGRTAANADVMPVIDLMHKPGILELCATCHFVFAYVNTAHENLIGTGLGMSTFQGQIGSRIERIGGVGLRTACPATGPTLKLLNSTQRSPLFPSPPGGQQLAGSTDFIFRGQPYVDMLLIGDLSGAIPMQQVTNNAFAGGYAIRRRNATRLCEHIVSGQCLQQKLPEACIAELLAAQSASKSSKTTTIAVAVSVAVGGVLLLAALGAFLWRRKRRRRPATAAAASGLDKSGRETLHSSGSTTKFVSPDVESAGDQQLQGNTQRSLVSSASKKQQQLKQQHPHSGSSIVTTQHHSSAGSGSGGPWNMVWSSSAPSVLAASQQDSDTIELGVLLGAGSFGRVYKGRWAGLEVAVKVIQHTTSSAKEVANEVQLMLALNHPNLVRAYHCVTKQLVSEEQHAQQQQQQQQQQQHRHSMPSSLAPASATQPLQATVGSSSSGGGGSSSLGSQQVAAGGSGAAAGRGLSQQQQSYSPQPPSPQPPPVPSPQAGPAAAVRADSLLHTTTCGSSMVSSSLGRHVQDLDPAGPPAYQRTTSWTQQQQQQQGVGGVPLASATPSSAGSSAAASSALSAAAAAGSGGGGAGSQGSYGSSSMAATQHNPAAAWPVMALDVLSPGGTGFGTAAGSLSTAGGTGGAAVGSGGGGASGGVRISNNISGSGSEEDEDGEAGLGDASLCGGSMCETYLVQEYCNRGTLARQAAELQPESNEAHMLCLLNLLHDVACGLKLLKHHNVVHADLNAHNVLVASSPVAEYGLVAKVADMGLSRVLKQHATHRTTRTVGMLTHQPPELLRDGRMSPAVDIYSFGVMMYEVFTRQVAFGRMRYGQIYNQVVVLGARPAVGPEMPEDYELLMRRCWCAEPSERPSVDMLLECLDLMIQDRQQQQQS